MLDSKTFLIIIVVGFLLCLIYNDCGCNEYSQKLHVALGSEPRVMNRFMLVPGLIDPDIDTFARLNKIIE